MAALQFQRALNLGAADQVAKIHRAHPSSVAVVTRCDEWIEQVMCKGDAITKAASLEAVSAPDCFVSQNPIGYGKTRCFSNISCLANAYVDLDTYKIPSLANLNKEEVLSHILAANPEMPKPTFFADSGRGMYLVWNFTSTKPKSFAPSWQQIEDRLIDQLAPYGADPKCKDVARVLRIAGTENVKAMRTVEYHQISEPLRFEDLQRYTNGVAKQKRSAEPRKTDSVIRKSGTVTKRSINFATKNEYTLHLRRMEDLRKLAALRGGFSDLRKTAAFCYSLSAAWYCRNVEALERELQGFIVDCFHESGKYLRKAYGPIKRLKQTESGVTVTWKGREYDPRYRMRNATLIECLQITPEEQQHMLTIISSTEKKRRLTEKRRAAGVKSRDEYEGAARAKAEAIRRLASEGLTRAKISEQLGVNINTVKRYLKRG